MFSLARPALRERCKLFDFVVEQLRLREPLGASWTRLLRLALAKQRDAVLQFAGACSTNKLAALAHRHNTPLYWVRQICRLQRKKLPSDA